MRFVPHRFAGRSGFGFRGVSRRRLGGARGLFLQLGLERVLLGGVVVGGGSGGGVVGVAAFLFNMSGVGAREFAFGIEPMFVVRAIRAAGGLPHLIGATGDLFVGRISRHGARGGWIRRGRSRPRAGPTRKRSSVPDPCERSRYRRDSRCRVVGINPTTCAKLRFKEMTSLLPQVVFRFPACE